MDSIKIWIRARSIYGLNLTGICHSMEFIGTNLIQVLLSSCLMEKLDENLWRSSDKTNPIKLI